MLEHLRPHRLVARPYDICSNELCALGIRGVILDLDNTLTPWKSVHLSLEIIDWIAQLHATGVHCCIASNAASARRVQPVADQLGIAWITRACKPWPHAFRRAMAVMGTAPDTTAVFGDQIFTDIFGANRLGLYTVLVEPVSSQEALVTRVIQRPLERLVGRTAKASAQPASGKNHPE